MSNMPYCSMCMSIGWNGLRNYSLEKEGSNSHSGNPTEKDPTRDKYIKRNIVIPYTQGLGESIKKIHRKYGNPDPLHG